MYNILKLLHCYSAYYMTWDRFVPYILQTHEADLLLYSDHLNSSKIGIYHRQSRDIVRDGE